jgi:hypothetical protein
MADQTNDPNSAQERKYTYTLIDPDDLEVVKATEYLVENVFVLGESTFVWGRPKFFKTFFVLAALLCVAMGVSFFNRKVVHKEGGLLYWGGERCLHGADQGVADPQ